MDSTSQEPRRSSSSSTLLTLLVVVGVIGAVVWAMTVVFHLSVTTALAWFVLVAFSVVLVAFLHGLSPF